MSYGELWSKLADAAADKQEEREGQEREETTGVRLVPTQKVPI